jgi:hypothetical protein
VWLRQCVISAAAVGSSAAAIIPLFITHDEYFVRCGGSGGGYYNVFDLSSFELLSGRQQCGSSALAAARRQRAAWQQCWQQGGGGGRAVAARQQQCGNGSVAVVAVQRQRGRGQRGRGVGSAAAAALAARGWQPAWWLRWKFGSIAAPLACFMYQSDKKSNMLITALDTFDLGANVDHELFMKTLSENKN